MFKFIKRWRTARANNRMLRRAMGQGWNFTGVNRIRVHDLNAIHIPVKQLGLATGQVIIVRRKRPIKVRYES